MKVNLCKISRHSYPPNLKPMTWLPRYCSGVTWIILARLVTAMPRLPSGGMISETQFPWTGLSIRDVLARMRHEGCGGLAAKAEEMTARIWRKLFGEALPAGMTVPATLQ